ncbi:Para-aminobenzoate synthase [Diplonema papillatum]|nr:Para-aminobenzoate synthase [Diplonema papillatum]KAJ9462397.1 Para-aminobenzoate synthase [Diplonema papillatum]KAJ9462398.1 Para-aminobenzoate synthase [Diplonema papillatum]KAJ9462401.1 Para-aminobenzoate synthase [Diplonema papillatum]KAJ9462402.1 Para-aminobenzoate synthase [Diplonema papillatum]
MEGEVTTGQQQQRRMLLVDNYDSYTYNLYQYIGVVTGAAPLVIKNHDPRSRDAAFVAQF